ncbi:MAG: MFS transporter [Acidimicrobiia bacterium]
MTMTARRTLVAVWGLYTSVLLLMLGRGLLSVTVGARAEFESFATTTTGIVMAAYFAGFLAGSRATPRFMARVGHIRVFSGLAALIAALALFHALWVRPAFWVGLQLVFGFGMAGLFVVAESWLNDTATNETRGRVMALYMVASMGGAGLGQLLLGAGDPTGPNLFLLAGALMALAVIPVALSVAAAPEFTSPPRGSFRLVWEAAPLGVVASLLSGLANASIIGLAAVYALQVGMPTSRAAFFAGMAALGAVVLQWPIGHLSDSFGRRRMILVVSMVAAAVAVVGASVPPDGLGVIVAMFVFGGLSYSMYSLALSHQIDVLPSGRAVAASSTNVFLTGVGAVMGPLFASVAMTVIGPSGFWWALAFAFGAIGLFAGYRFLRRPRIPGITPEPYVAVPARSAGIVRLVRRNGRRPR